MGIPLIGARPSRWGPLASGVKWSCKGHTGPYRKTASLGRKGCLPQEVSSLSIVEAGRQAENHPAPPVSQTQPPGHTQMLNEQTDELTYLSVSHSRV